jgi:dCMP deaminase
MKNNYDNYFMLIAKQVGSRSKCLSRKIGSVLVKNDNIISTGYNGAPRGVKHCNERDFSFYLNLDEKPYNGNEIISSSVCPRKALGYKSGKGTHLCNAVHSEVNAIVQAARNGISTLGTTLFSWCCLPCKDCMSELINAGVKEVVCLKVTPDYDNYSRVLADEAGLEIRELDESEIK